MGLQTRGGIPRGWRGPIDTTGRAVPFAQLSAAVGIRTTAQAVRVFFTEEDFDVTENYLTVAVDLPMLLLPMEERRVWLRAAAGTATVELVVFHRKG